MCLNLGHRLVELERKERPLRKQHQAAGIRPATAASVSGSSQSLLQGVAADGGSAVKDGSSSGGGLLGEKSAASTGISKSSN